MQLSDGTSRVELGIVRYESDLEPDEDGAPEPEWVVVRGVLAAPGNSPVIFEGAALDTEEARHLSAWMHGVATGAIDADPVRELSPAHIFFCEPEIQAWLLAREHEFVTTRWYFAQAAVDITVTSEQFRLAATDWTRNTAEFPDR